MSCFYSDGKYCMNLENVGSLRKKEKKKKKEGGRARRKCKLGRLDTGGFPLLSVCRIHLLIHNLSCIRVP